jgi:hypothetical protein
MAGLKSLSLGDRCRLPQSFASPSSPSRWSATSLTSSEDSLGGARSLIERIRTRRSTSTTTSYGSLSLGSSFLRIGIRSRSWRRRVSPSGTADTAPKSSISRKTDSISFRNACAMATTSVRSIPRADADDYRSLRPPTPRVRRSGSCGGERLVCEARARHDGLGPAGPPGCPPLMEPLVSPRAGRVVLGGCPPAMPHIHIPVRDPGDWA